MRIIYFFFLVANIENMQSQCSRNCFFKTEMQHEICDLSDLNQINKTIPKEIELQTWVALSFYPELKNAHIRFELADIKTTMETRPTFKSLFKKRHNREYVIYIDTFCRNNNGILLDSAPFNTQIGLIGHELAHIKYYEQKNGLQIMTLGIRYQNAKFKAKYEKLTDQMTIDQGLGWQLYDWSDFVFNLSNANQAYLAYKKKFYMLPDEIQHSIKRKNLKMFTR